jgi:hypothetical protein
VGKSVESIGYRFLGKFELEPAERMKISKQEILRATLMALLVTKPAASSGQTNLNFNNVSATVEGAIRLNWNSTPNEYYQVYYADSLVDTNTGTTTWNLLYDDYPSQGSSTFWLDTGNYFIEPPVPHPARASARFYQIALSGTNTVDAPAVSITSPGSNSTAIGTLTATVLAGSDQPLVTTKLYVDGEEMPDAAATTNYVSNGTNYTLNTYTLNTCEWPNGSHILFATARCESGASGPHDTPDVLVGRSVSGFIPVTFNNLITRISFSQPFFAPGNGQTQHVSAVFAANANWTLQIQDIYTNTVQTIIGSGTSLDFDWDGTGSGGINLPVGLYTYLISAQTNGQPFTSSGSSSSRPLSPPPLPSTSTDVTQLWAVTSDGSGDPAPLCMYPPGSDTNSLTIFEGPRGWSPAALAPTVAFKTGTGGSGPQPEYAGPSSQSSRAPTRPPTAPVRGSAGNFGVAYDTYRGVASGYSLQAPDNGLHLGIRVQLENRSGNTYFTYASLFGFIPEAHNFVTAMKRGGWSLGFDRFDDMFSINDLRGSGTMFNQVKLGLLMLHGTYGTSPDYTANGCQQMYFPITSGASAQYLRMSEMNFGSADTNGLKWMAINACNSLYQPNWFNMQNYGVQPWNGNLHLLLGTDSVSWSAPHVESYWARYMTWGKIVLTPMKIQDAWFTGAQDAFAETGYNYTNEIDFAVTGDFACKDDYLQTNSVPTGSPFYVRVKVWPSP